MKVDSFMAGGVACIWLDDSASSSYAVRKLEAQGNPAAVCEQNTYSLHSRFLVEQNN